MRAGGAEADPALRAGAGEPRDESCDARGTEQ